jgi:tetratricopeptide (TPR) repeat protein
MRYKIVPAQLLTLAMLAGAADASLAAASDTFDTDLAALREEWAAAAYEPHGAQARAAAFETVVAHAADLRAANPERVEAVAWEGIILSDYAGEVGALSAMKYAKAARDALLRAEKMNPTALAGGVYVSLGALYSKVPGGIVGFGDDARAAEYFQKALAVDADNIDNNFFYGDFLLSEGEYAKAAAVLEHALEAPPVEGRPIFDAGRREEIRALLATARGKAD